MNPMRMIRSVGLCSLILCLAIGFANCQTHKVSGAPHDLTVVNNPEGGQFAFGTLTGEGTKVDALIYMLHNIHEHFGDKPQVGKFFQSRDGNTLATFFTLKAKKMKDEPVMGLLIVTMPGKSAPQVSVLYDHSKRFVTTEPSLLKAVSAAWEKAGVPNERGSAPQAASAPLPSGGPERLNRVTGGDHSAVVALPQGWRLTHVAGGTLDAEGPRGEMVDMGVIVQQIVDPRSPQAQSAARFAPGPRIVWPMSADLFPAFVNVTNQARRNAGRPQGNYRLISSLRLPPDGGPVPPLQAIFTVDFNDGIGPRKGSARIGAMAVRGSPTWAMTISSSNAPVKYADAENATMMAIIRSYSQDANVIAREGAADLGRIHEEGVRAQIQGDMANQRRESSKQSFESHMQSLDQKNAAFDEHMGNIDWSSKVTQDYILDRSVVKDIDYDATATTSNKFADSLVQTNPNRFEIVQNQDLIRGRDY